MIKNCRNDFIELSPPDRINQDAVDGARRHHTKRGPPIRTAPDSQLLVCQAHGAPIGEPQMVLSHSASLTCLKPLVAGSKAQNE